MILLKNSTMLSKLGNIEAADATSKLTATVNAYNISAEDSIEIVDTLVVLDNTLAASTQGIADGMQKASSMAKQAGVSYQNLASYIGVVISNTQQSGDTVGQAFKSIFARLEQVKAGATIDEEGQAINNVEKVLIANGIQLRDSLSSFRDMDDVLADVAKKYKELGKAGDTVAQGQILTAVAGTRQINIVSSLFDNWEDVVKAQKDVADSAGIAKDRYEIFMQSIEASANKFKASWEGVWQTTAQSDLIKWFYDAGAAVGNFTSMTGGLIPVITDTIGILIVLNSVKVGEFFANASKSAIAFAKSLFAVEGAAALTKTQIAGLVVAGVGLGIQIYSWIKDATDLNKKIDESIEKISNISSEISDLENKKETIQSLSQEFLELSKVVSKSADQQKRYNDIQNELKELLPTIKGEYDALGNYNIDESVLNSNSAYNKLLQERIDLKKEELGLETSKSIDIESQAYEKNIKKIGLLTDQINDYNNAKLGSSTFLISNPSAMSLDPKAIKQYEKDLVILQDQNLEYIQSAIENFDTLTTSQQLDLLKQIENTENFQKAFLDIWMNTSEQAEDMSIIPDVQIPKTLEELTEAANKASSSVSSTFNSVIDLIGALEDSNVVTMAQVESLKELFPVDETGKLRDYTDALSVENGQTVVNINTLKELTIERGQSAVAAAQEAFDIANAANISTNAEVIRANETINASLAIIQAKGEEIATNSSLTSSEIDLALKEIDAAKARVLAEKAVLAAKGQAVSVATTNLDLAKANLANLQSSTYWNNALADATGNASSAQEKENEALEAYNDLLDMTIKMIKQQKEDQISALEDQLDAYKNIIDAKKESLDLEKEADDYADDLADKNKILSDIDNELLQLQFDNSEEGKRRRLELESERADAVKDIDELQADRSYDIQIQALDDEYDAYEETMDAKIEVLQDYLDQEGTITSDAIALLQAKTDTFYQSLIEWNRLYGSGIDSDVIDKWAIASNSVNEYASTAGNALSGVGSAADSAAAKIQTALSALNTYEFVSGTKSYAEQTELDKKIAALKTKAGQVAGTTSYLVKTYHEGGVVGGGLPKIKESEVYAKLLKGEVVNTDSEMKNFINNTLPNMVNTASAMTSIGDISMSFNVAGNLDKTVLPDIKEMVSDTLIGIFKNKGIMRNASSYSI